ncbi:MAG: molybdenum ABC transporter ATP-binding protein, partial [Rhodothermales bacterium]|nr:molybdenum ABC transporter ATP-binding protein [Rhodothermales bacterium]
MTIAVRQYIPGLLDAELTIPGRGITGVIGPSGAGKTLLIRSMAGLESADGHVRMDGTTWDRAVAPHERQLGVVLQKPGLLPHLSVNGNLKFALDRRGGRDGMSIRDVVGLLGIEHLRERRPDRLSGGETQRVAIARALLTAPRLMLMDEPVSALDGATKAEILRLLLRVQRETGVPVLYVSHDLDEIARIADHLALLESGRIRASGPLAEMLTRLDLPLAHASEAESVLQGRAAAYDEHARVLDVDTDAGILHVVSDPLALGTDVRVRLRARDVSLSLDRPGHTSILNVLGATVAEV